MKKQTYIRWIDTVSSHPALGKCISVCDSALAAAVYAAYVALIAALAILRDGRLIRVMAVPAVSFALVTVFRALLNRKRPYEVFETPPVIAKDTKGRSFPSRHVFSAFVIAMACLYVNLPSGIIMLFVAVIIAGIRVAGGVHFVSDVAAGALAGILSGIIGFYLI